jgi:dihydropteroate synthase
MGVLNVTPDSFSDGGRFRDAAAATDEALAMVAAGAHIIDVGGESTRPGAPTVPVDEELRRTLPVIEAIRAASDVVVSIDTSKAAVAEAALAAGADIVNDVSGFTFEPEIADVTARYQAGAVLMHTTGRSDVMDARPIRGDVVDGVRAALSRARENALAAGVPLDAIALDPGFGFGKNAAQNYALLKGLDTIVALGSPVLVGVSRKRMIRHVVGSEAEAVAHGTTAAGMLALVAGAQVVRVHDVVAGVACAQVAAAWRAARRNPTEIA